MRILAVDYGSVRIGLALSDPLRVVAKPLPFADGRNVKKTVLEIAELCRSQQVGEILMGLPLKTDGSESESCLKARQLAEKIAVATSLPVNFLDERYTSKTAEQFLLEGDVSRKNRRKLQDGMAAMVLLQDYLYRCQVAADNAAAEIQE